MARIKGAMMTHKRRKKMLKLAKGFYGCKSKHFKMAKQQVMKSGNYALAAVSYTHLLRPGSGPAAASSSTVCQMLRQNPFSCCQGVSISVSLRG